MKKYALLLSLAILLISCLPSLAGVAVGTNSNGNLGFENTSGGTASVSSITVILPASTFFDSSATPPGTSSTSFSVLNNVGAVGVVMPDDTATDGQRTAVFTFASFDPGDYVQIDCDFDFYANPDGRGDPVGASVSVTYSNGASEVFTLQPIARTVGGTSYSISGPSRSEINLADSSGAILIDGSSNISLGAVSLGASGIPLAYTISNTGTDTLTGISIAKDGAHPGDFAISNLANTILAPGQSMTFTITFTPGAAEFRTCMLHIASNDADENPFDIRLTGTGATAAPLALAQNAYLKAGDTDADDRFGNSVAISGNTVVVGVPFEDSSTVGVGGTPNEASSNSGAVYVFVYNGTTWTDQGYLKPHNTGVGDQFGVSVAISGDTIIVGADGEDSSTTGVNSISNQSAAEAGAAYIFARNGSTWSQQAYLKASNTGAGDGFGYSVAISGDTVVVGALNEDSSTTGVNSTPNDNANLSGAAYVFNRSGTSWSQQAYLKASNTGADDYFGISVAVSGDTVVVGAYGEDSGSTGVNSTANENIGGSGAAYIFTRSGTSWSQQAYLKASNTGADDFFGFSVAVSGDTVVIGALREDSSTTGVNSTPNNSAIDSGAAYVFTRSGTTWSQQAYLKASNTGASDEFGRSVAVSGDTVVVGARNEDSSATGVNGTPNESANESGAVYVLVRSGGIWSQRAYLKASNTEANDQFGFSVAVSGTTVIAGAWLEDSSTTGGNSAPDNSVTNSGAVYVFPEVTLLPEILVEWSGVDVDGVSVGYSSTVVGDSREESFTIRNTGVGALSLTGSPTVAITGPDAGNFSLSTPPGTPVAANGSTIFTVRFAPSSGGYKTAVISIPNNDPNESPYLISIGGTALSFTTDGDGDGMNDASEFKMASLGFDWQVSQPALVTTYYSNANGAGLFSPAQVQALHTGTPLIARNPLNGRFKLTMDWKKSTDLSTFSDFPAPAGSSTSINGAGDIDFEFTVPDNAAFFRIEVD